jgi:uncharacterized Ntn-hydrolase superfamily protein
MTFSILARCPGTGMFGMAIASSSPAVAARCAWARAGVGVAATQNVTDPDLGPHMLNALAAGADAAGAVAAAVAQAGAAEPWRQLLCVDGAGGTAAHTGARALGRHAVAAGDGVIAGGNLLADEGVPAAMVAGHAGARGALGDRLVAALLAGREAGGEAGPVHSAGLLLVDRLAWPVASLRIDWVDAGCPIAALARAWTVYAPQMADYVTRAQDPGRAPGYGVAGEAPRTT